MAKVYDIINKLTNNKPIIKIDESHEYTVNNSKNSAILIKSIGEDKTLDDIERIDKLIEAGIGKEALDYVNSLDLSLSSYGTIVNAIMAAIGDRELEEVEEAAKEELKRFQKRK